jgi:Family of unknown function (DUF5723)
MVLFIKKVLFVFLSMLFFLGNIFAQQSWGMANSNFAGVSNIDLNPSSMVFSKCAWDINVLSVDASLLNNSFFTDSKFIFPTLLKPEIQFATANSSNQARLSTADLILRYNIQGSTFLNIAANIKGPSYMYSNGFQAFAITTAFRGGVSAFNLPLSLVQAGYENLNGSALYNNPYTLAKNVDAAAMAWLELGGSYARKLGESEDYIMSGGVSLKILVGYSGGYALSNGVEYNIPYRANLTATNLNLSYGHSITNESNPISITNPLGSGISGDIGFTIIKKKDSKSSVYYGCPKFSGKRSQLFVFPKNYKWKLGISMIDLGGINFSTNAAQYTYQNVAYSWDTITRINVKTLKQVDQTIYNNFNGAQNATQNKSFFIWAPTAVSSQLDYNFNDFIYANLSIVQRVVFLTQARLARMNTLALTPRYESPNFEIAMPFIINEYSIPNLGLMVRYKYFFIGSDQIGSTLGFSSIYGLSLYFGIKINHLGRVNKDTRVSY